MRAVQVEAFGGPDQLRLVEIPDPAPGPGQVLVEVAAAGVNRADVLVRSGGYHRAGQPPLVLGLEGAGTVVELGAGVPQGLAVGDRVVAMGATNTPGFYAELAAVPVSQVVQLPDGVESAAAAALPTAWLSAWYCLRRLAGVQAGECVLVHAAASGVGSAAVQIARDAGATVIAVAGTPQKAAWARELGAQEALDSGSVDAQELVAQVQRLTGGRGADVVLDTVGGDTFATSLRAAGYAGRVVSLANVALVPSLIDTPRLLSQERPHLRVPDHQPAGARLRPPPRPVRAARRPGGRPLHRPDRRDVPPVRGCGGPSPLGEPREPRQGHAHRMRGAGHPVSDHC